MASHLIGLLLGTEEDWPTTFETLVSRVGPVTWRGETHELPTERITNEPFDLRAKPRYALVIDRLSWWYELPRGWLKKVSLMDDVYLLNNPFTFQAMEKHSAYCAMMRLGLHVPDTWMLPHKAPPGGGTWAAAAQERFPEVAAKYNLPFELDAIGERVGYPLFMKPFDGGMWVGVTRITSPQQLHEVYDASGQRLMHLQAAVEDFDVFTRTLTIGPESMTMKYRPDRPQHDRYEIAHDFLTPELGNEVVTISQLVNAFFRWEFNSCETLVKDGVAYPIDYANASPDVALTSLHYYFPWAITALIRWSTFCAVTRRRMRINQNTRDYFDIGDRDDLSYEEKLSEYRRPRGRVPPGRRVRGVLRRGATASRRDRARLLLERRLRPAARGLGDDHVPRARARALRRALPRAARRMGARTRYGVSGGFALISPRRTTSPPRRTSYDQRPPSGSWIFTR